MDPGKVHKNGRMTKIATLTKSEAIVLKVPPTTEGENHTERRHVGYGSRVRSHRGAEGSGEQGPTEALPLAQGLKASSPELQNTHFPASHKWSSRVSPCQEPGVMPVGELGGACPLPTIVRSMELGWPRSLSRENEWKRDRPQARSRVYFLSAIMYQRKEKSSLQEGYRNTNKAAS